MSPFGVKPGRGEEHCECKMYTYTFARMRVISEAAL